MEAHHLQTTRMQPSAPQLQERPLLSQSGIEDSKNDLQEYIVSMEAHKKETAATLQTETAVYNQEHIWQKYADRLSTKYYIET